MWIGLVCNAGLAVLKLLAGWLGNSRALIADAAHTLSDLGTDAALLLGSEYWSRPPDALHPYGHRRFETLIAGGIGGALLVSGLAIGWRAALALIETPTPTRPPGRVALAVALLSMGAKELLFRRTNRVARRTQSLALQANAWHHRSDAWSSLPVVIAVGVARLTPSLSYVDNVGALVVAVLLLQAALRVMRPALGEITELGAPSTVIDKIQRLACATPGVRSVHGIRSRYAAGRVRVDLHVQVAPQISVREGHRISSLVCDAIHAHAENVLEVLVHIEPFEPTVESPPAIAPPTPDSAASAHAPQTTPSLSATC